MTDGKICTRAYSTSSAGCFVSAKAPQGDALSHTVLMEEFRNHPDKWNRVPTALVSVSDRIVDSLKRAIEKHRADGESPAMIWIAFIEVPPAAIHDSRIHSAKRLAEQCNFPEPTSFSHEAVFEWAIPEKYVLHEVSLPTLMKRGLEEHDFFPGTTAEVRWHIARSFQGQYPEEIGYGLGFLARIFGARAPLRWISHQLFCDCVRANITDDDAQLVRLDYAHGHTETVDFGFLRDLDDGIDTSLYEWWLADTEFFLNLQRFEQWRGMIEESGEEQPAIEAKAVRIGL